MQEQTLYKTVKQYNKYPIKAEDMEKLSAIARDYKKVKQYVYQCYSGIKSLEKLYPGYTVQNEMTQCGLRTKLDMPSVYYNLAVFEALGDIKSEWSRVKAKIRECIHAHEEFTEQEKHYLRYCLKVDRQYASVLNHRQAMVSDEADIPMEFLSLNQHRLNAYLCRLSRRYFKAITTGKGNSFRITERAYRYDNGGIYISTKEKRKRVFVELTDKNTYVKQLTIKLIPEENRLEVLIPLEVKVKTNPEYVNAIGLAPGFYTMLTSSTGNQYGLHMGEMEKQEADRIRVISARRNELRARQMKTAEYDGRKAKKILRNNLGSKKYIQSRQKHKQHMKAYINQEINRLLKEEKPAVIYYPRQPGHVSAGRNKQMNYVLHLWKKGYILERLKYKCQLQGVQLKEIIGKEISILCAECGEAGTNEQEQFLCRQCGFREDSKINTARNVLARGQLGMILH